MFKILDIGSPREEYDNTMLRKFDKVPPLKTLLLNIDIFQTHAKSEHSRYFRSLSITNT